MTVTLNDQIKKYYATLGQDAAQQLHMLRRFFQMIMISMK